MSFVPTGPWTITKRLQYVEESTFGTTPTASPTFTSAGVIRDVRETTELAAERYRQLGSEDMYMHLLTGRLYSFEVVYQPFNMTLARYGTQAQGGGTGTIDKSLSFILSEDINDTENYIFMKGAKADRTVVEVTPKSVMVTQNYICRQITVPATSHGLTTPTFASADTSTPWVGADSSSNPLTFNSANYDTDRFRFEVTRQLDAIQPNGSYYIEWLVATNREINGDFDTLRKNTTLLTDCDAMTARTASYVLSSTSTASFTNMRLTGRTSPHSAGSNKVPRDTFKFSASAISVSQS